MHADRPPRRTVAVLAGLSCLLLPLLAHVPKASAATANGGPDTHGSGSDADACSRVSRSPYDFTRIVVQYKG
ncbi:hypothetical protein [Streptomyces sp. NPDC002785]|uniref:hypothetical protein n=1 Tax=Streptomyces sp. NPDC002785 TaxID=3154543 RepID=UPI0033184AD5